MKTHIRFGLTTRLTLLTVGAITCAALAIGLPAYNIARIALKQSAEDILSSQVQTKRLWLVDVLKDQARNLSLMQRARDLHQLLDPEMETSAIGPTLEKYRAAYHYHDVLIISGEEGKVLFSAAREEDLGTSLLTGPYRDTGLARAYRRATMASGPVLEDMSVYAPSDKPALFMAAPLIGENGRTKGVVAVQLSIDQLNQIMRDYTGLRATGDTFLIGEDQLMRSNSRHSAESTVLKTLVDSEVVRHALDEGDDHLLADVKVGLDYRGVAVLSAFAPMRLDAMERFFEADFDWILFGEIDVQEAFAPVAVLRKFMTGLGIVVLLVIGLISFLISRKISRSIGEGVQILARAASEISATISQIASGATETAAAVAQTTTTVDEVRQTAQVSSDSARDLSSSSQSAEEAARLGTKASMAAIEQMELIETQTQVLTKDVNQLGEGSRDIGDIILSVNDLADQSNLLAVNASIEAAKAGEHGRGFNVVAQEIRNLSEQSKEATRRVRTILSEIRNLTDKAVEAAGNNARAVAEGIVKTREASRTIASLAETAEVASRSATQIAASSQQQLVGMEQVAAAMEGINQASGQSRESTTQLNHSADNLQNLGDRLLRLIRG